MYWPCGVTRVYAHTFGKSSQGQLRDEQDEGASELAESGHEDERRSIPSSDPPEGDPSSTNAIIQLRVTRSDVLFATLTETTLDIWSSRPATVLASLVRSNKSLQTYGNNVDVLFRPDNKTLVLQTVNGYLINYTVALDASSRVYQQQNDISQARRQSIVRQFGSDDSAGLPEVTLLFRRAIKIDAGINAILALDHEIVIATIKPAAIQCIGWEQDKSRSHGKAQLISKMDWVGSKTSVVHMSHDRAMNLSIWIMLDGSAYAVQRPRAAEARDDIDSATIPSELFHGFRFHSATEPTQNAMIASINARFSLICLGTASSQMLCYAAKDYVGNIPYSHQFRPPASAATSGSLITISWSPDGYCLLVGFQNGWCMYSVFGFLLFNTFDLVANPSRALSSGETYLLSASTANWSSQGSELLITSLDSPDIHVLSLSRSAAITNFSCSNLVRALLQTSTELLLYRGHDLPDLTSIANDASLWHHAHYPTGYLNSQAPIRLSAVSPDGRYIAIAGRRGLAHYSVASGRWKTFNSPTIENSFAVRGGMTWFGHVLVVATESAQGYDVRLYSRDIELGRNALWQERFASPVVFIGPSGEDSLLIYTHENTLYHYVLQARNGKTGDTAQLVQVGQIAFHGIVRAPSRVRSVSWILPDAQMRSGDPARDVEFAAVLFLVDDKLVLLQPLRGSDDSLKYDMKVVASRVEYYILMRDQIYFNFAAFEGESDPVTPNVEQMSPSSETGHERVGQANLSLRDSLWIFCGEELKMWSDVQELLRSDVEEPTTNGVPLLTIPLDFYPLSILLSKGVVLGIESELLQRRHVAFSQHRSAIRSQLFIPYVLQQQLCEEPVNMTAALALASQYQHLSYFPHAVEILLHTILDEEVEKGRSVNGKTSEENSQLPKILSFLQTVLSPTKYLSTIVQCIRKTEVTSWQTLFVHLPPPLALFEEALEMEDLKTAGGFLIVLQGFEEEEREDGASQGTRRLESHVVRLMKLAAVKGDFELCSELARFLMAIDPRGGTLKRVIDAAGFEDETAAEEPAPLDASSSLGKTAELPVRQSHAGRQAAVDDNYFTVSPGGY